MADTRCSVCGTVFTPLYDYQRHCSLSCAVTARVSRQEVDTLLAAKRRNTLLQRFPTPDTSQSFPQSARSDSPVTYPGPDIPVPAVPIDVMDEPLGEESASTQEIPQTILYDGDISRDARAYAIAGKRYGKLATQLLRSKQTIILTGYGCGIRVEHDALVVTEGRTYYPQQPVVHTLQRGLHRVDRIVCLNPRAHSHFRPWTGVASSAFP